MYGNLFIYDPKWKLVAFESGPPSSNRCLILIGGLSDGLLSVPYVERLSSSLESLSKPYSLIQPLFRSSNLQYGWHTIDDDVEDLKMLIDYLTENRKDLKSVILMGHSTGCQDIIHYLRQGETYSKKFDQIILQGPVSDRQYLSQLSSTKNQLNYCLENNKDITEWLPRHLHDPPLTIQRCQSFNQINSIEDLFSSDLTDQQLDLIYQHIQIPIAWIWSKQDEYVPDDIKQNVQEFIQNKLANKTNSTFILLHNADHAVDDQQEQIHMIEHIRKIISSLNT